MDCKFGLEKLSFDQYIVYVCWYQIEIILKQYLWTVLFSSTKFYINKQTKIQTFLIYWYGDRNLREVTKIYARKYPDHT